MGLDMYLKGRKYHWTNWEKPEENRKEDEFPVKEVIVELGYWRKEPDLHGFIVKTFAEDGKDDCKPIELSVEDVQVIIDAIKNGKLPHTEGFFFGASPSFDSKEYRDFAAEAIKIFEGAIRWYNLNNQPQRYWPTIEYEASW